MGLGCYKWYQSQTPGDVSTRRLNLKGECTPGDVPMRMLGSKGGELGGPTSIGEGNEGQRGRWVLKGVDCEIPYQLERGTKHSF